MQLGTRTGERQQRRARITHSIEVSGRRWREIDIVQRGDGETRAHLQIEAGISLDGNDEGHRVADLDEAVGRRGERALADLDVELGRSRVAAERHDLLVEHVHREADSQGLVDVALPEAADRAHRVPDLLDARLVLQATRVFIIIVEVLGLTCTVLLMRIWLVRSIQ